MNHFKVNYFFKLILAQIKDKRFKSTQSTGNDRFFLWNKGETSLVIFDTEKYKINEIQDFWMNLKLKRTIIPIACGGTKDATKLFGFGMDSLTEETMLIYYKKGGKRSSQSLKIYEKYIDELCCCEISQSGKMIYIGGTFENKSLIGALRFTHEMKPLKLQQLESNIEELSSITRVLGTDILLCGCPKSIMIVKLDKKNSTFLILCKYTNIGEYRVGSAFFNERYLYSFMPDGEVLVKFEYQKALDYQSFFENEHIWWKKNKEKVSEG